MRKTIEKSLGSSIVRPLVLRELATAEFNKIAPENEFSASLRRLIVLCSICALDATLEELSFFDEKLVELPDDKACIDTGVPEINATLPQNVNGVAWNELFGVHMLPLKKVK